MGIQSNIKKLSIEARKNRDKIAVTFLTTLYSEIASVGKNKRNSESTDDEAIKVIKKFIKDSEVTMKYAEGESLDKIKNEISILNSFLPEQLTDEQLDIEINAIIKRLGASNMKDMGKVMGSLKVAFSGLYDGRTASNLVRSKLS